MDLTELTIEDFATVKLNELQKLYSPYHSLDPEIARGVAILRKIRERHLS